MNAKLMLQTVESRDPDRFRAAMLAGPKLREDLLALYAFHCELARIPELVSEPMLGEIRYQWWRDRIEEIYQGGAANGPQVLESLIALIHKYNLPKDGIIRLVDGRARDLDPEPFADIDDAKAYVDGTSGALMTLAINIARQNSSNEKTIFDISSLGLAWGLSGLARSWSFYNATMLSNLGLEQLCTAADDAFQMARRASKGHVSDLLPACAYVTLVPNYLKRIKNNGDGGGQIMISYPVFLKQLRLLFAVVRGRL